MALADARTKIQMFDSMDEDAKTSMCNSYTAIQDIFDKYGKARSITTMGSDWSGDAACTAVQVTEFDDIVFNQLIAQKCGYAGGGGGTDHGEINRHVEKPKPSSSVSWVLLVGVVLLVVYVAYRFYG